MFKKHSRSAFLVNSVVNAEQCRIRRGDDCLNALFGDVAGHDDYTLIKKIIFHRMFALIIL